METNTLDSIQSSLTETANGLRQMFIALVVFAFVVTVALVVIAIKK